MRFIAFSSLAIVLSTLTVSAQDRVTGPTTENRLDCVSTFRDLDRNRDGVLDDREMGPNNPRIPTGISTSRPIREEDFVRVCAGGRTLPQGGSPEN